jgi:multimeric flavodoxin WrbA
MSARKVVVLDGCGLPDQDLAPILNELLGVLGRNGSQIETFHLHALKFAHCLGCFNCWVKTPGMCVENDAGRQIARAVIQSDSTVFFTPVTFGGYSAELKKMLDHFIQLISPFFAMDHGEVHHPPRYTHRPRLLMVGVQRRANQHEAHIFRTLAGRNAINLHPPTHAAEVVVATDDAVTLRRRFESLLTRSDALPFGESAASLMPPVVSGATAHPSSPRRALLIVGSPKINAPSTSCVMGSYLLKRLGECGWESEVLTLRAGISREDGSAGLLAGVDHAGLILLAFPLYADALPYLVTKALAVIATHRQTTARQSSKRLVAIVNSGFPEIQQNAVALAICEEFAAQSGIAWAGGLALAGGGMIGGQPLTETKRSGPSVKHVIQALDLTAAALSDGFPVPAQAIKLMAKNPVPYMPFALWRLIYMRFGGKGFEQEAARNGISRDRLLDQPYAA